MVAADTDAAVLNSGLLWESSNPSRLLTRVLDVRYPKSWPGLATACERFGRVDILVNSAGITGARRDSGLNPDSDVHNGSGIEGIDPEISRNVLSVNLSGTVFGIQAVMRLMKKAGGGSIVNIASISGVIGNARTTAY